MNDGWNTLNSIMTFIGGIAALIASLLPLVGRRGLQKLTGGLKAAFPELLEVALALTSVVFFFATSWWNAAVAFYGGAVALNLLKFARSNEPLNRREVLTSLVLSCSFVMILLLAVIRNVVGLVAQIVQTLAN